MKKILSYAAVLLISLSAFTQNSNKYLVKDDGITNPVHEKYAGQIVFSAKEISKDSPDESAFANSFSITSAIHFRIYLKSSIFNEVQKNKTSEAFDNQVGMLYRIYLDGSLSEEGRVEFSYEGTKFLTKQQLKTQTSISGIFNFNKDAFLSSAYMSGLVASDAKLTDGKHTFKIELYPIYNSIKPLSTTSMASGSFDLMVTKGFVQASNAAACLPKAAKKDAAMETKFKECMKNYLLNNNKNAVLKSFVLLSTDWDISRNELTGIPISKTMYGAAGLAYKDGSCKYETYSFTQNWNGSSYSSTIETSSTGQDGTIFCDCLNASK